METRGRILGGRYELQSLLAGGGMGQVWRARDTRLQRPVAVKILRSEFIGDPAFLTRFRAEAQHTALLAHPNIAAVHDYGESLGGDAEEHVAYLVMELVEGEPLSALLARVGRLDVPLTLSLVRQTASALAAAHAAGVVHRDVKPGNVLVRPDGVVKVTDFGIAWSASSAPVTRTGQVIGTAHYLSPEQAQGGKASPASDVYALGLLTYECLTGERAFDGENSVQVAVKQIRESAPPLPSDIPEDVRRLVGRAIAKDPADRFADGAAFQAAVEELTATGGAAPPGPRSTGLPVMPVTAPLPRPAPAGVSATRVLDPPDRRVAGVPRRRRGRPWFIAALVLLGLVLIGGIVVGVLTGTGGSPATAARTTATSTSAPTSTSRSTSTSTSTPTLTTVSLAAADVVGRPLAEVRARLTALGFQVQVRPFTTAGVADGQVIAADPVGSLSPGQTVTITYAVAPPTPVPTTGNDNGDDGNGNGNGNGHGHGHRGGDD